MQHFISNFQNILKKENLSFILIVSVAYLTAINYFQRSISYSQLAILIVCSSTFLLIGIFGFNFCKNKNSFSFSITYFLVQLGLAFCIIQFAQAGLILLIMMALVSQAIILLTRQWLFLFCGLILFIIVFPIAPRAPLAATITATSVYLAGITFVVVFTQTALNEKNSHIKIEHLAIELNFANQQLCQYIVQSEELTIAKERNRLAREPRPSFNNY